MQWFKKNKGKLEKKDLGKYIHPYLLLYLWLFQNTGSFILSTSKKKKLSEMYFDLSISKNLSRLKKKS